MLDQNLLRLGSFNYKTTNQNIISSTNKPSCRNVRRLSVLPVSPVVFVSGVVVGTVEVSGVDEGAGGGVVRPEAALSKDS